MPQTPRYRLPGPQVSLPELARIVADCRIGRLDVGGAVTLATGTTSTTVRDSRIGVDSVPVLVPTSSGGAALDWWCSARGKGELVLGHAAPGVDTDFLLLLIG